MSWPDPSAVSAKCIWQAFLSEGRGQGGEVDGGAFLKYYFDGHCAHFSHLEAIHPSGTRSHQPKLSPALVQVDFLLKHHVWKYPSYAHGPRSNTYIKQEVIAVPRRSNREQTDHHTGTYQYRSHPSLQWSLHRCFDSTYTVGLNPWLYTRTGLSDSSPSVPNRKWSQNAIDFYRGLSSCSIGQNNLILFSVVFSVVINKL